jgi:hypothetical protein
MRGESTTCRTIEVNKKSEHRPRFRTLQQRGNAKALARRAGTARELAA